MMRMIERVWRERLNLKKKKRMEHGPERKVEHPRDPLISHLPRIMRIDPLLLIDGDEGEGETVIPPIQTEAPV